MRTVRLRYGRVLWLAVLLSTALCFCGLLWSDFHFMSVTQLQYRRPRHCRQDRSSLWPEANDRAEPEDTERGPVAGTTTAATATDNATASAPTCTSTAQAEARLERKRTLRKPLEMELLELQAALDSIAPPNRGGGGEGGAARTLASMTPFEKENMSDAENGTAWGRFSLAIGEWALYSHTERPEVLAELLASMRSARVVRVQTPEWGTQIKFFVDLADGTQAVVKPMRLPRDYTRSPDLIYYLHIEQHVTEIVTYHLDRIFGFYRVPPCVGRVFNFTEELEPLVDREFQKTVFTSPVGNKCFYGSCYYYCDHSWAICGRPHTFEASVCAMLPFTRWTHRSFMSPWRRAYHRDRRAPWELPGANDTWCPRMLRNASLWDLHHNDARWLDMVDVALLDFLIGNMDRHHFEYIEEFGSSANLVMLDNGKGMQTTWQHDVSVLAPLYQCCVIRRSTYVKLLVLHESKTRARAAQFPGRATAERASGGDDDDDAVVDEGLGAEAGRGRGGVGLSDLLRYALSLDPLARQSPYGPLVRDEVLRALDERVHIILHTVQECIHKRGAVNFVVMEK